MGVAGRPQPGVVAWSAARRGGHYLGDCEDRGIAVELQKEAHAVVVGLLVRDDQDNGPTC
jgi:hypothetical protein